MRLPNYPFGARHLLMRVSPEARPPTVLLPESFSCRGSIRPPYSFGAHKMDLSRRYHPGRKIIDFFAIFPLISSPGKDYILLNPYFFLTISPQS